MGPQNMAEQLLIGQPLIFSCQAACATSRINVGGDGRQAMLTVGTWGALSDHMGGFPIRGPSPPQ